MNPVDLRIDVLPTRLPGADERQCTLTAVRVTHIPTGRSVTADIYRSGPKNKDAAVGMLEALLT